MTAPLSPTGGEGRGEGEPSLPIVQDEEQTDSSLHEERCSHSE